MFVLVPGPAPSPKDEPNMPPADEPKLEPGFGVDKDPSDAGAFPAIEAGILS